MKSTKKNDYNANTTVGWWITMVFPVGFVYLITPMAWLTVLWHYFVARNPPTHNIFYRIWFGHAICDIPFSLFLQYLSRKAQAPKPLQFASLEHMKRTFLDCLEVGIAQREREIGVRKPRQYRSSLEKHEVEEAQAMAARDKYRKWFVGNPPIDQIKKGNIYEWCAWAIANKEPQNVEKGSEGDKLILQGIEWLENRVHYKFEDGYNPKLKSVRLTIDPVKTLHRPFGYYVVTNAVTQFMYAYLYANGCRFEQYGKCSYITRGPRPRNGPQTGSGLPTFFIHGLGIGIGQYIGFLKRLVKQPQPIAILIQPNISTQIYDSRFLNPPNKEEHVESFKILCNAKGWKKVTVLSHSNGTFVHGWLLRGAKEYCARNILTDPVGFRLWEADICHAFVHQPWYTSMQALLGYFVARELGTAHTIARLFVWTDMMMWEYELPSTDPANLQIVLAGNDFLIDSSNVVQYLKDEGISDDCILNVPGAQHGAALIVPQAGMKRVLASL